MTIKEAQNDMRLAYLDGGPGVLISGAVWLVAAATTLYFDAYSSLLALFFGGMLIHPLGILLTKGFKRSGKHQKGNPLAMLAIESTVLLFVGLFMSYCVFQIRPDWFFPIMLLIIGARYLLFQSLYGMKIYWILGAVLIMAGAFCLIANQPVYISALSGGLLELLFAVIIIRRAISS